jgi:hypothetical protein
VRAHLGGICAFGVVLTLAEGTASVYVAATQNDGRSESICGIECGRNTFTRGNMDLHSCASACSFGGIGGTRWDHQLLLSGLFSGAYPLALYVVDVVLGCLAAHARRYEISHTN